jgi:voltage-gated potassium channel Kch
MLIGLLAVFRSLMVALRRMAREPEGRGLLTLVTVLVAGGAFFYRQVEDLSWLDSFYFTIVTLTTVGYGDIAPQTVAGKIFTMAYLLIGIGLFIAFVTEIAKRTVDASAETRSSRQSPRD